MSSHFRAVIFDMDGTLFGTERIALDAIHSAFAEHGVDVPAPDLEFVIGLSGKESRAHLAGFAPGHVGIDAILQRGRELFQARLAQHGVPIKPGVVALLEHLRQSGTVMAVATSSRTATAMANLRQADIAGYFAVVVGGDQVENPKPYPDIYVRALRELHAAPEESVAVEDSDYGLRSAHGAGLRVIYVPDIKAIDAATRALAWREYSTLADFHAAIALTRAR
jgi:HAD superfamily hydrolase (TIGR01509 family)